MIYTQQDCPTIITRAWNLVKANLKESLVLALLPSIFVALIKVIASILVSKKALFTLPVESALAAKLTLSLLLVGLGLIGGLLSFITYIMMYRFFYLKITEGLHRNSVTIFQLITDMRYKILPAILYTIISSIISTILLLIEILIFTGCFMLNVWLSTMMFHQSIETGKVGLAFIVTLIFVIVLGLATLTAFSVVVCGQVMLFTFPLLYYLNQDAVVSIPSWLERLKQSMRLVKKNIIRIIWFTLLLYGIIWILTLVFSAPIGFLSALEDSRLGISQSMPLHIHILVGLSSGVVALFNMPFQTAAITLFFYDCRVRQEGLDLKLSLDNLSNRTLKPEEGS